MNTPVNLMNSDQAENPQFDVFISHRKEDQKIAESLSTALNILSKYCLNVHCFEKIPGGEDWGNWIEDKIAKSNILIFLYTSERADWSWCLYEIGLFRDLSKKQGGRRLICIKNSVDKPPSPIGQFAPYNSDKEDILRFFKDLFFEGTFTNNVRLNDELFTKNGQQLDNAAEEIDKLYRPSGSEEIFYARRVGINLFSSDDKRNEIKLDEAFIRGDEVIMEILDVHKRRVRWKTLYENFKRRGEAAWLDELKNFIDDIRLGGHPSGVMTPFSTRDGRQFIPVLSRIERTRSSQIDRPAWTKRLFLIFIPKIISEKDCGRKDSNFPLKEVLASWTTYLPCSVVRIRWHKKSGSLKYEPNDMDGEPVIYAINPAFARLFVFKHEEFPDPDGHSPLTKERLLRRLEEKGYMQSEYVEKVFEDQAKIGQAIIFEGSEGYAQAPFQFTEKHPNYPKLAFLPCMVSKQVIGSKSREHEMYLLIIYVKDFWPFDDPKNPYHQSLAPDNI